MKKEVKKIFLTLGLYAMSGGFFYNFQELWMSNNNLSTKTIGIVFSLCALITVSTIFLCSNLIKQEKIKKFTCLLLLLKTIILFILFFLNNTGLNILIKFLIMMDYVIDVEIYACIYPMITLMTKNDKVYAARELVYEISYYIAVLLTGFFLGKTLSTIQINYNFYCLLGAITIFLAYLMLKSTDLEQYYKKVKKEDNNLIIGKLIKIISRDKISKNYIMFTITGQISYYCLAGLMIILLTDFLSFTPSGASYFILALGISACFIGTLILNKLTLKNDYINISIKYVGRLLTYLYAVLSCSKIAFLIAIVYTKLTSVSYSHITDAPYINRFDGEYQLAFCNLREMFNYFSRSIGSLLCGLFITINIRCLFLLALIFILFQLYFAYKGIYLRKKEKKEVII